ncbi:MAG: hypothetical protein GX060_04060 [Firmicutes bacterium]|nr:hypothetical protein [Bacillota bacterium]
MAERSILSFFSSEGQANQAKEELAQLGYEVVQVDRVSRYPSSDLSDDLYNPLSGQISSVSNLVLGNALLDDAAILAGSDPSVSGMSAESVAGRYPYILTVVTDSDQIEQAVEVIKRHGGYV